MPGTYAVAVALFHYTVPRRRAGRELHGRLLLLSGINAPRVSGSGRFAVSATNDEKPIVRSTRIYCGAGPIPGGIETRQRRIRDHGPGPSLTGGGPFGKVGVLSTRRIPAMDSKRFDELARGFASRRTRRDAALSVAAGLLGLVGLESAMAQVTSERATCGQSCSRDGDCNAGLRCSSGNGICVRIPDSRTNCSRNSDCSHNYERCNARHCVNESTCSRCAASADCPTGQVCRNGRCGECSRDRQCGRNETCRNGRCERDRNACDSNRDCRKKERCRRNRCVRRK